MATRRPKPRVRIHPPRRRDRDEVLDVVRRSRTLHRGWMTPGDTSAHYAAYLQRMRDDRHAGFLVRRLEDDAFVGLVNMNEIVLGAFHSAYLGYWVGGPFARQGYMTDGLDLVLREAFGKLKLHRVEANIQPTNAASIALARRLGFRHEGLSRRYLKISGRWRDHERYALLVEDWRAARKRSTSG
ncbi:MAG: GNAT family N-acetyltransferase [Deltaproteobacteria bacterium]|nr:GNAT family N-acetyltransferase [Deltaproteobacteria bacterium]MBW2445640.1 GNAT family N-acetyltransferase [Deltaproteobacteria bacterium]